MTTVDIVCTTIGNGAFLLPYTEEIVAAGAEDRVRMIVIPDRKTPMPALREAISEAWKAGIKVECPEVIEQESFLSTIGAQGMFPLDSDGRRNIGYLMSWRDGADIMITIDDDNLPTQGWLKEHEVVAAPKTGYSVVSAPDGFWNPCGLLGMWTQSFWPRGYPYSHRWTHKIVTTGFAHCDVAINAGLWLGDPDVDAITRLAMRPEVTSVAAGARECWQATHGLRSTARTPPSAARLSPRTASSSPQAGSRTSGRATSLRRALSTSGTASGSAPRRRTAPSAMIMTC